MAHRFSFSFYKWPSLLAWVIFLSFSSLAQDYRPTENFKLKSPDGPTTRQDGETYDGKLSEEEYLRRREEYLREFRNEHSESEYRKEKSRINEQVAESKLNQEMQKAREREQKWQRQEELKKDLKKNPVVVESLEEAFDQANQQQLQQAAPQVSREKMMKELQGLQDKIKSGNVNMDDVFKALNKASGSDQADIQVPDEYRGQMAEQIFKTLHQVRSVPPNILDQQLRAKLQGHPLEGALKSHDSIIPKAIEVIQDPQALPDASMMLSDKEKLLMYALINLGLLILGMFLKRKIRNSGAPWSKRFTLHLVRWFALTSISLCVFIYFFGEHMQSLWRVLTN